MHYRLALLPLLGSLVAALPTNLEEENKNSIMLPNAFMVYDVLAIPEGGEYDWRGKDSLSLGVKSLHPSE